MEANKHHFFEFVVLGQKASLCIIENADGFLEKQTLLIEIVYITGADVEMDESFKFVGINIANNLSCINHIVKRTH